MSRRTVVAVLCLALALVAVSAAAAKKPPPPPSDGGGGGNAPSNLRITASSDTSISLAWDAGSSSSSLWWYCVVRNGEGCLRVDPPRTTFSLTKLWPGRTTTYTVVTVNANGDLQAQCRGGACPTGSGGGTIVVTLTPSATEITTASAMHA